MKTLKPILLGLVANVSVLALNISANSFCQFILYEVEKPEGLKAFKRKNG